MRIDLRSTLSQKDEERLALQVFKAAEVLLVEADYVLTIETSSGEQFVQTKLPQVEEHAMSA